MSLYGKEIKIKKNFPHESQKNTKKISRINLQVIHQIFNTINISLLVLIFTLFFISFDSQRKWSSTYKILSKTKAMNNNLIDYISQTEEFYISELETLDNYKKTKPRDLIYLDRISEKKDGFFKKNFKSFIEGFRNSKYQRGY